MNEVIFHRIMVLMARKILPILLIAIVFGLLVGCSPRTSSVDLAVGNNTPKAMSSDKVAAASATATKTESTPTDPPSPTPDLPESTPTSAPKLPTTLTAVPTSVPSLPAAPDPTPTPFPDITPTTEPDRTCPETIPLKPQYDRFYLSAQQWPTPDPSVAETHFWLSKPLPGAGRTLINQQFPYGWDGNGRLLLHNGVDIAEEMGMDLLAVADGTVVVAQADQNAWYGWRCDWYGHLVVIELDQTWQDQPIYVLYGHVLNIKVEPGERVERGQPVAEIGIGGAATNPHLHLEVRVGENAFRATRNPMLWIDPGPTRGVIAGRLIDPEGRPWQGVPLALVGQHGSSERGSTWSYLGDPQKLMNPDEGWAENFIFSDIKPGEYDIYTSIQGVDYKQPATVRAGEVATVTIQTQPLKEDFAPTEEGDNSEASSLEAQ